MTKKPTTSKAGLRRSTHFTEGVVLLRCDTCKDDEVEKNARYPESVGSDTSIVHGGRHLVRRGPYIMHAAHWLPLFVIVMFGMASLASTVTAQPSLLQSDGKIHNYGTIKILGDAAISQDTIGGVVSYERDNADSQLVAHLTYADLHFSGVSRKKMLDNSRPVEADSLFWTKDSNVVIDLVIDSWIRANRTVVHNGTINPGLRYGRFALQGTEPQDVSGTGLFPVLELYNDQGAFVTNAGGFEIYERLDLQKGQITNAPNDNFVLLEDAWIWRDDSGSLGAEPRWNRVYNLRYYGDSAMIGGFEMVRNPTAIGHLYQEDTAGLWLPYDITVNDSLVLHGHLYTEQSDAAAYELFYSPDLDPLYVNWWPEVIGTLVRTRLIPGKTQRMNNVFTSIQFQQLGGVEHYSVWSKPSTTPLPLADITFKADRYLRLKARTAVGDSVADSTYRLTFGYAWRNAPIVSREIATVVETTPQLAGQEDLMVLMRWKGFSYDEEGISVTPTTALANPPEVWRYSTTQDIVVSGDYAIGLATGPIWVLNTKIMLEGPLRTYGENFTPEMATDLAQRGLLPTVAPNIYPYSLDPNRATKIAAAIGDSIVDWVTVEFRASPTASGPAMLVETLLLTKDGQVLDPVTLRPRIIADIPAGKYNIAVRHRNHLSVITEDQVTVARTNLGYVVDLTTGVGLLGGAASQKLIGTDNGRRWFGLIAGEVTAGDQILRDDYNLVWDNRNIENYVVYDTDLNGLVTTRDLNVTWNNRERLSVAPR
jgi:hypothetical protein